MDFKRINEQLQKYLPLQENMGNYNLTILVNRDRDNGGNVKHVKIKAQDDLQALYKVCTKYDIQNKEDILQSVDVKTCLKNNDIENGVKLLIDMYFEGIDTSDYYDNILKLENPEGKVIFEDSEFLDCLEQEQQEEQEFKRKQKEEKRQKQKEILSQLNQQAQVVVKNAKNILKQINQDTNKDFKLISTKRTTMCKEYNILLGIDKVGEFVVEFNTLVGFVPDLHVVAESYKYSADNYADVQAHRFGGYQDLGQANDPLDGFKEWIYKMFIYNN